MAKLHPGDSMIFRFDKYNYKTVTGDYYVYNIMINDDLLANVLKLTVIKSKREAVEQRLQILLVLKQ